MGAAKTWPKWKPCARNLFDSPPPPRATAEQRRRMARYFATLTPEQVRALRASPWSVLAWSEVLAKAERAEGIVHRPTVTVRETLVPVFAH